MRTFRDVLRLHYREGYSLRATARCLRISVSTVSDYIRRAATAGLSWPLPAKLTDEDLRRRLFPIPRDFSRRPAPDWEWVKKEIAPKGVTLHQVWQTYREGQPDGYSYSRFCELFREWRKSSEVVMRLVHKAGEALFVDYAGQSVPIVDPDTGAVTRAQIFVATLGYSSYTYVEATEDQKLPNWIASHRRAFEFFGAVPRMVVPDNLKAAVTKAHRYDPEVNRTYQELAVHYDTAVHPARTRAPKDKAKVEFSVKLASMWILARLRKITFFSIEELNRQIAPLLKELNSKPFQKREGSRKSLFESVDRPAMRPLPTHPYVFREWRKAKVHIDYHVAVHHAFYSVPYRFAGKRVDVCITDHMVECYFESKQIALHARSSGKGSFSTDKAHMPEHHRFWANQCKLLEWARRIGPCTDELARYIMVRRDHPQQGYRTIQGILGLSERYGEERLEAAARRALRLGGFNYKSLASILKNGLDRQSLPEAAPEPIVHENIRGGDYYGDAN